MNINFQNSLYSPLKNISLIKILITSLLLISFLKAIEIGDNKIEKQLKPIPLFFFKFSELKKDKSYLIIQNSNSKIVNTATENLVNNLNKVYGKKNVVLLRKNDNGENIEIQGELKNIKGQYNVKYIGHGEEINGVRTIDGYDGEEISQELKALPTANTPSKLISVELIACNGGTPAENGFTSLVDDVRKNLVNDSVKVKGYIGRVNVDILGKVRENIPLYEDALPRGKSKKRKTRGSKNNDR